MTQTRMKVLTALAIMVGRMARLLRQAGRRCSGLRRTHRLEIEWMNPMVSAGGWSVGSCGPMGASVLEWNPAGYTTGALPCGETTQHPCRCGTSLPSHPLIAANYGVIA